MTIHLLLASLRKRSGMTMRQLAAAVGLSSPNSIWLWEHGERLPSVSQLGRFLDAVRATDPERLEALRLAGGLVADELVEVEGERPRPQGGPDTVVRHFDSDETVLVPEGASDELGELGLLSEGESDVGTDADPHEACTPVSALFRASRGAA
jgi:transcriptional regulator with XRE-family HTH domain